MANAEQYCRQFSLYVKTGTEQAKAGCLKDSLLSFQHALLLTENPQDLQLIGDYIDALRSQLGKGSIHRPKRQIHRPILFKWFPRRRMLGGLLAGVFILDILIFAIPNVFASVAQSRENISQPKVERRLEERATYANRRLGETVYTREADTPAKLGAAHDAETVRSLVKGEKLRILPMRSNGKPAFKWYVQTHSGERDYFWFKTELPNGEIGWMESEKLDNSKKLPLIPAKIVRNAVNMRQKHSRESEILTVLSPGSELILLPQSAVWENGHLWFQTKTATGWSGWVVSEYLYAFNGNKMVPVTDAIISRSVETFFAAQQAGYQGEQEKAIGQYTASIALNRTYLNIEDGKVLYHRGIAYQFLKQYEKARQDYQFACQQGYGDACQK